jgi:hypothetical protein
MSSTAITIRNKPQNGNKNQQGKSQQKKRQQRKPKKNTQKQQQIVRYTQIRRMGPVIQHCSLLYWKTLTNPWEVLAKGAAVCIPDLNDQASMKFSTRMRGTLYVGTAGVGFIALCPVQAGNNSSVGACSAANYAGTGPNSSGTGVTTLQDLQYPWNIATSSVAPPLVRLVACGVRIRYTGTELNRAGNIMPFSLSTLGESYGVVGSTIMNMQSVKTYPNNRQWCGAVFNPTLPSDYQYTNGNPTYNNGSIGVVIMGDPTSGNSYEYDIVRFWEALPALFLGSQGSGTIYSTFATTKSESDLVGMSAIKDFMGTISQSEAGQTLWNQAKAYIAAKGISIASQAMANARPALEF